MTRFNGAYIVLSVVVGAEAFAPSSSGVNDANSNGCRRTLARATIYYPEDDGGYTNNDDGASSSSSSTTAVARAYDPSTFFGSRSSFDSGHDYDRGGLLGRIVEELPWSTLARLASAHSPLGRDVAVE
jgi:hypothetical protein